MTWNKMLQCTCRPPWNQRCYLFFGRLCQSIKIDLFNLFQHFEFGINAKWVFFATSHGKQPCDGIGGTVKKFTRLASFGRATCDQILTPKAIFNIEGINFICLLKDKVDATRAKFAKRFNNIKPATPGKSSFDKFVPITKNEIEIQILKS